MKRIKLADRRLPDYTKGEEIFNMVSHIVGGGLGVIALILCLIKAILSYGPIEIIATSIYGICLIFLYTMSSTYHGLHPSMGKQVLRVLDHCAIYALIAGSYTIVCLGALRRAVPVLGWGIFALEWGLCAVAITLTAIDLKRYRVFSMLCYIGMGWAILPISRSLMAAITPVGFWLLFSGGIVYTIGAILYGLGSKLRWMHSVFHIFVVLGSTLHFFAFYLYGI